ncbi:hypothetical protein [Sodalis-like endosymbiont of Proechinophthirus fluctus]|uniref:hypothetical protein n=1 Tax=Sodalis-like endosymbiont of Proechinophthirus fluctus TaxID=1462730 RepID=UPI000AA8D819|nr:hypothetical protein [Sodalis-like endosymbiont of Proechinophthirus fluctus]
MPKCPPTTSPNSGQITWPMYWAEVDQPSTSPTFAAGNLWRMTLAVIQGSSSF